MSSVFVCVRACVLIVCVTGDGVPLLSTIGGVMLDMPWLLVPGWRGIPCQEFFQSLP